MRDSNDERLPDGHPKVAYIGVDGGRHRMLVPVQEIWIKRAEGPKEFLGEWTFEGPNAYGPANARLGANQLTAPKTSGYDKHDFKIIWADGQTYHGRFDLETSGQLPSLDTHIRDYFRFIRDNPHELEIFSDEHRAHARMALATYDMGQPAVAAPEDWVIVHDFREGKVDYRALQEKFFPTREEAS